MVVLSTRVDMRSVATDTFTCTTSAGTLNVAETSLTTQNGRRVAQELFTESPMAGM